MISNFAQYEHRFLSNFFYSTFIVDGLAYKTVEHYFQSQKTLDYSERYLIHNAATPSKAKELGKKCTLRADWEQVKVDIMRRGIWEKFCQNCTLKQRLIDTDNEELREGNYWSDIFWGVDETTGQGQNWLGRILMETREKLKFEQYTKLKP